LKIPKFFPVCQLDCSELN